MIIKINKRIFEFENLSISLINSKNKLMNLSFITLSKLCSVCFENSENKSACIYFNNNFQLKTFKLKEKAAKLNQLSI